MTTRLSDGELAARTRAGNRQRATRQHEKRRAAGLAQLNVWLSASTRAALATTAAANGETLSATVERLLSDAIKPGRAATVAEVLSSAWDCWKPPEQTDNTTRD